MRIAMVGGKGTDDDTVHFDDSEKALKIVR
jgi:hypothetical protein